MISKTANLLKSNQTTSLSFYFMGSRVNTWFTKAPKPINSTNSYLVNYSNSGQVTCVMLGLTGNPQYQESTLHHVISKGEGVNSLLLLNMLMIPLGWIFC